MSGVGLSDRLRFGVAAVAVMLAGAVTGAVLGRALGPPVVHSAVAVVAGCADGTTGASTRARSGTEGVTGGVVDKAACPDPDGADEHDGPGEASGPAAGSGDEVRVAGREFTRGGERFFWLADTAWSLFVNLDRAETTHYLDTRSAQGFTVIQAVAIFPQAGGPGPNRYGDSPFGAGLDDLLFTNGADPGDAEQYDYWDHVGFVVAEAAKRDLVVAILPVWADGQTGRLVTTANARGYGRFLGARFGTADNIVWIMGGDAPADGAQDIWRELAAGLADTGGDQLATYHPRGDQSSVQWFAGEDWIDFHMLQGGHCLRHQVRAELLKTTYAAGLPFVDGEPIYEDHPYCWEQPPDGYSTALDVRRDAWWAVLGGAAGHTYGHHAVWQFLTADTAPALGGRGTWTAALDFPGAGQMRHVRALIEARPRLEPADDLVADPGSGAERIAVAADAEGRTLVAYTAAGREIEVDLLALRGKHARPWWYDPRTGEATELEAVMSDGPVRFSPPDGEDWVLVVDDEEAGHPDPGRPAGGSGPDRIPDRKGPASEREDTVAEAGRPAPEVDLDGRLGASGRDPGAPRARPAEGAADAVWDRLAECESSGNWSAVGASRYYGGLQIDLDTWRAYGGTEFAARPDQATKRQQILVATRIRDDRGGYGSWPACARELGLPA